MEVTLSGDGEMTAAEQAAKAAKERLEREEALKEADIKVERGEGKPPGL